MKFTLIIIVLLCTALLFSETIVDSVYSIPELDGFLIHNEENSLWGMNNTTYTMYIGDVCSGLSIPPSNSSYRSFLSFELPYLSETSILDSVILRLYQLNSYGNGVHLQMPYADYPSWEIAGGDTVKCLMSHIDYGDELYFEDWNKGDIGNPFTYNHNIGEITHEGIDPVIEGTGERGYRYLNVTESVLLDYENNRDLSQYRIAFEIDTDYDDRTDRVSFKTNESWVQEHRPVLFFYSNTNANNEETEIEIDFHISISPNPVSDICNINFEANRTGIYSIELFNIRGQKVKTMQNLISKRRKNVLSFDSKNLSNGIYLLKISNNAQITSKKITIIH